MTDSINNTMTNKIIFDQISTSTVDTNNRQTKKWEIEISFI